MKHFKEIGIVVYLHASYQTIKRRIRNPQKRGVVLKDGQTLKDLYDERKVLFEKYADVTISEEGCQIEETITLKIKHEYYRHRKRGFHNERFCVIVMYGLYCN